MENEELYRRIKKGDKQAFELLFHKYYAVLCALAEKILRSIEPAKDIVQEVFLKLWTEREQIQIETSVKAFLFQWVKNKCLNYLRHLEVINLHQHESLKTSSIEYEDVDDPEEELLATIYASIQMLSPQCQRVFKLSRFEGLKHKEIAEKLGISVKTVKIHIGKALSQIRQSVEKRGI